MLPGRSRHCSAKHLVRATRDKRAHQEGDRTGVWFESSRWLRGVAAHPCSRLIQFAGTVPSGPGTG